MVTHIFLIASPSTGFDLANKSWIFITGHKIRWHFVVGIYVQSFKMRIMLSSLYLRIFLMSFEVHLSLVLIQCLLYRSQDLLKLMGLYTIMVKSNLLFKRSVELINLILVLCHQRRYQPSLYHVRLKFPPVHSHYCSMLR